MPSEPIADCQVQLHANLDEVLATLDFSMSAFKTYASSGQILGWVASQQDLRAVVEEFRKSTRLTDLNFLYQALYVQAWSAFELFVRALIVAYLETICNQAADYDSMKKAKLIERNLYHTGIALQQVLENRSNVTIDFFSVARNVATSIPDSKKVVLNTMSFGIFLKGPSVQGIEEALKRIGVKEFNWDNVGSAKPVQKAFGTGKPRETTNQLKEFLQNAEKRRNSIVHRGERIPQITETDLRHEIAVFNVVGDALADFLKTYVSKL